MNAVVVVPSIPTRGRVKYKEKCKLVVEAINRGDINDAQLYVDELRAFLAHTEATEDELIDFMVWSNEIDRILAKINK